MFGNCHCVFMIGQFLFMSEPPAHPKLPLCAFPSILSVMLTSTSAQRHRTAAGEVEGGRERGGKRGPGGKGWRGEGWKELVLERAQEREETGRREEGTEREAKLQVWPKCQSWPSPAGGRVLFYTHLFISGSVFLTFIWLQSLQSLRLPLLAMSALPSCFETWKLSFAFTQRLSLLSLPRIIITSDSNAVILYLTLTLFLLSFSQKLG